MSVLEAVILGIVQGLTEFLPVSSSGHLVIAEALLGVRAPGVAVEVVLHVATLLSVVIVYQQRLRQLARGALDRDHDAWRFIGLLALASVPAGLVGVFLEDQIERAFDAPAVTGVMLLVTGGMLWSTRRRRGAGSRAERPGAALALGIGIAQAFAILPGISRSGATITAGLWGRLPGERAAEFSFLMSIPAIAGAAVLQAAEIGESWRRVGGASLAAGFAAALVVGVLAIRTLVWLLRRQAFHAFAYYVWPVGALFLLYLALRG